METKQMKLNENLKKGILIAYQRHLKNEWINCDRDQLNLSYNTIKFALDHINEFAGDEQYKQKLIEIGADSLYIINELLLCWDYDKEPLTTKEVVEGKEVEQVIVYRYKEIDAKALEDSESKRKKHYNDLQSQIQKNNILNDKIKSLESDLIALRQKLNSEKSLRVDFEKKLKKFKELMGGIQ